MTLPCQYLRHRPRPRQALARGSAAFTLAELLVSIGVLALILAMFGSLVTGVQTSWMNHEQRTSNAQGGRAAIELLGRELAPALVDTRMQFAVIQGTHLADFGCTDLAPNAPAIFWMAPLGPNGSLRMVGYYLTRPDANGVGGFRLKRAYASPVIENLADPTAPSRHRYFPRVSTDALNSYDVLGPPKACDVEWLLGQLDANAFNDDDPTNDWAITSTTVDNVVALWIQPIDLSGRPIPWLSESGNHPVGSGTPPFNQLGTEKSQIIFNSASFFLQNVSADPTATDSFIYKGGTFNPPGSHLRANQVPAAVEVTLVLIDERVIARLDAMDLAVPQQTNVLVNAGSGEQVLDLNASLAAFNTALHNANIESARRFTTRIEMLNGGT